jgi:hypothetical protein
MAFFGYHGTVVCHVVRLILQYDVLAGSPECRVSMSTCDGVNTRTVVVYLVKYYGSIPLGVPCPPC